VEVIKISVISKWKLFSSDDGTSGEPRKPSTLEICIPQLWKFLATRTTVGLFMLNAHTCIQSRMLFDLGV